MLSFMLLPLGVVLQLAAMAAPPGDCSTLPKQQFARKADLPNGVIEAFGASIAEKGERFQVTDVIAEPPLPIYRFMNAEQQGCRLRLEYEHGGRGYGITSATFLREGSGWKRIGHLFYFDRRFE